MKEGFELNFVRGGFPIERQDYDLPNALCVDRKGAGYDFETETGPKPAVEIMILESPARME
jgi:hypothetical protein